MLEYCVDDLGLVYEADYLHSSFTLGAGERINLIDFLNQPRPCLATSWGNVVGLNDAGDFVILRFSLKGFKSALTAHAMIFEPGVFNIDVHA
jgi:hypothetical protein